MPALLKTTQIQEPSSASVNLTLDTSGNGTFAGTSVMSSPYTMRNKIINGAMVIDQRNAGASVGINSAAYITDRYNVSIQQGSGNTAQRSTIAPSGFSNSLLVTVGTGASPAAGSVSRIYQAIEGFNCADLAWGTSSAQTITLSFWVRSSLTGTFAGGVYNNASNRTYVFTYTINSANTFEQKTITITGDTSGTWTTDNTAGIYVNWDLGSGSTYQGTAGSWAAGAAWATSGSVKLGATSGATFYITGVQLERGTVATPFEYRNYQQELAMCMRYYQKTDALLGVGNNTNFTGTYLFPTPMRASPSLGILANGAYTVLGITDYVTLDHNQSAANIAIVNGTRVSSTSVSFNAGNFALTTYRYYGTRPNETAFMTISAEL